MKVPMDPDNSFGTSVVLGPAYRDNTDYYHHPLISEIRINGTDENHAVIKISALAKIGDLDVTYMIYLEDASLAGIRCHVKQIVNASVPIRLNVQMVDLVGVEPTIYPCHGYVLPLDYRPGNFLKASPPL